MTAGPDIVFLVLDTQRADRLSCYGCPDATSPHLECVEERIRLDGRPIESAKLETLIDRVLAAAAGSPHGAPTYFEALVAAGFLAFADAAVDLAVVEVGLGGRLDATNCAEPAP